MKFLTAILLLVALLISVVSSAQKKGDSKITITLNDTSGIYEKVRLALTKSDFIIKDLNQRDTITTFPRVLKSMDGSAVALVYIEGVKIILSGFYSTRKQDFIGYTATNKDLKPIIYYNQSGKLWPLLMKVANEIGGDKEYSK